MTDATNGEGMLETLEITRVSPRESANGFWVDGTIAGHRFQALIFRDHADLPEWELGDGRIAKLWLKREADGGVVASFERGWHVRPTTDDAAIIVDLLAAGLAEHVLDA